jgi:hypothetical protein
VQRLIRKNGHFQKQVMRKTILYGMMALLAAFGCGKSQQGSFQHIGVITGYNEAKCPCPLNCPCVCGALLFHFTDTAYRENIYVDNAGIFQLSPQSQFPVYVQVNYKWADQCGVPVIHINGFRKI